MKIVLSLCLLVGASALAQDAGAFDAGTAALCRNDLTQDRQPDLTADGGALSQATGVNYISPKGVQVNTARTVFNPNNITVPFDQRLDMSFVFESAGASHSVGYFFYDALVSRGYVDTRGTPNDSTDDVLVDSDNNGIADFHEDLFNVQEVRATSPRAYVGGSGGRRCTSSSLQFSIDAGTVLRPDGGSFFAGAKKFYQPDIALDDSCTNTFATNPSGSTNFIVGTDAPSGANTNSDNGTYTHIPNLLEPAATANGFKGLGRLVFLLMDDDTDNSVWNSMAPVSDSNSNYDGVPDYDVSAYDALGNAVGSNPDPGITSSDRTVSLGTIPGNREIVFFSIVYYSANSPNQTCLIRAPGVYNGCRLAIKSPINVFFTKTMLNLDLEGNTPVAGSSIKKLDIGCNYTGSAHCSQTGTSLDGWLDSAALTRLAAAPASGGFGLTMPHEANAVISDPRGTMPHIFVGAPTTDPTRWIFGVEDLTGGGDRDFNDIVFLIDKKNGGYVQSSVLTGDISPSIAEDFTISSVRFTRADDVSRGTWTELVAGACSTVPLPKISYSVAVDCKVCDNGVCIPNDPSLINWVPVIFTPSNAVTTDIDLLSLGYLGSQLCWKADLESYNENCTPTITNVDVGYQALRAGNYAKSSVTPMANAITYGQYETPGQQLSPAPTRRTYDNKKDLMLRGHFYFETFYDPETPTAPSRNVRWEAGAWLADAGPAQLEARKLLTLGVDGGTISVTTELASTNHGTPAFPTDGGGNVCNVINPVGKPDYLYDLNRDGVCNAQDRVFLRDWLFGWEDKQGVALRCDAGDCFVQGGAVDVERAWPMGGVTLSTPAIVGPPVAPDWLNRVSVSEASAYRTYATSGIGSTRNTVTYVGTSLGFFHAFDTGTVLFGDDSCTSSNVEQRGYFAHTSACLTTRKYGSGAELFAYLPRLLIDDYRNHYVGYLKNITLDKAVLDATPSVADVDLGGVVGGPWVRDTATIKRKGAMTVIVSATGSRQDAVFALNVDDPNNPVALWEYQLGRGVSASSQLRVGRDGGTSPMPPMDTLGSRHSPPIVRIGSNNNAIDGKWVALVATDYVPNTNTAATVYTIDLSTGAALATGSANDTQVYTGITPTSETNFGIGGSPAVLDVRGSTAGSAPDGKYDVAYVATTNGKIYRLNFYDVDTTRSAGKAIGFCPIADVRTMLMANVAQNASVATTAAQAALQGIYSPIAVRYDGSQVELYVGTSDNPDNPNDATATNYYVLSLIDPTPSGTCSDLARFRWAQKLDDGQQVWGGVTLSAGSVYTATAVGTAADACNLSEVKGGKFYAYSQAAGVAQAGSGTDLNTHVVSAPVVYDEHLMVSTIDGQVKMRGGNTFNNTAGANGVGAPRILLWEAVKNGKMPP
ncbi:MAG: DUF4114 domain-containing protein [Myxococcaceae bacterium]|nr:DUF4114 domain-containing protein [Myxococcaceae bacterium]